MTQENNTQASNDYNLIWSNNRDKGINKVYLDMGADIGRSVYIQDVALYLLGWTFADTKNAQIAKELNENAFTVEEIAFLAFFR